MGLPHAAGRHQREGAQCRTEQEDLLVRDPGVPDNACQADGLPLVAVQRLARRLRGALTRAAHGSAAGIPLTLDDIARQIEESMDMGDLQVEASGIRSG